MLRVVTPRLVALVGIDTRPTIEELGNVLLAITGLKMHMRHFPFDVLKHAGNPLLDICDVPYVSLHDEIHRLVTCEHLNEAMHMVLRCHDLCTDYNSTQGIAAFDNLMDAMARLPKCHTRIAHITRWGRIEESITFRWEPLFETRRFPGWPKVMTRAMRWGLSRIRKTIIKRLDAPLVVVVPDDARRLSCGCIKWPDTNDKRSKEADCFMSRRLKDSLDNPTKRPKHV